MSQIKDKYEPILKANGIYNDTYCSFLSKYSPNEEETLYISVFAPVVIEFVRWVLIDSLRRGIKRLYFLARDAYSMYLAARMICSKFDIDIECRYLCVSRYAMRVPEYHLIGEKCIDRICVGGIDVTFRKILMRTGLSEEEISRAAEECGYKNKSEEILNHSQICALKNQLKMNKKLLEKIHEISKKEYINAVGYLCQEGMLENAEYAIVDSGWIGTLQQSVKNILKSAGREKILQGYYFGMYELPTGEKYCDYRCFYFNPKNGLRRKVYFSNCLFESIFSAPYGMTVKYEKKDGRYNPVYLSGENPNGALICAHIQSLENYTKIWLENVKDISMDIDYVMLEKLLSACMGSPSVLETEILGKRLFSDDVLENTMKTVAAKLSQEEIKTQRLISRILIMLGIKKQTIHESAWIEGSVVQGRHNVKRNLRHVRIYKYFSYLRKRLK